VSRIWAQKGTRPRLVQQQQFTAAYIFGATCPENSKTAGLIMPKANTEGMQQHLDIISATVTPSKHALLVVDRAAWHLTAKLDMPTNITIMPLPPAGIIKVIIYWDWYYTLLGCNQIYILRTWIFTFR
jgi:hypothetical protein